MILRKAVRAAVCATTSAIALLTAVPASAAEYDAWHRQIANSPYVQRSANFGQGVRIAVLDTGTAVRHVDLRQRLLRTDSMTTAGGRWYVDGDGHGTSVASAAVGTYNGVGIVGVAPRASLLTVQISTDGSASSRAINLGLRRAVDKGAKVINLSFGDNGWERSWLYEFGLHKAMQYAARHAVIVVSAGNDGNYKPDDTAMHLLLNGVAGAGIMAGSVDRNNMDSSFSNAPGTVKWNGVLARNYFLNAPGEDIRLASHRGGYEVTSGTSFSAPIIAGAAALVRARHPHLTPKQTVSILLNSALDLGSAGTDGLYGRGLLQVSRALQAAGAARVASGRRVGGPYTLLSSSALAGGAAMGSLQSLRSALAGAVIFDDYGRDFAADFDGRIVTRGATVDVLQRLFDDTRERVIGAEMGDMMLLVAGSEPVADRRHLLSDTGSGYRTSGQRESVPEGFALAWRHGATEMTIGHGSRFAEGAEGPFTLSGVSAAGPVFALAEGGAFGRVAHDIGRDLSIGARFSEATPELAALGLSGKASAMAVAATWQPNNGLRFEVSPTFLREDAGALGSLSSGATSLADSADTLALTTSAAWSFAEGFALRGHLTEGVTTVSPGAGSLFRSVEPLRSRAYGVSLEKAGVFEDSDTFGVAVSRPLRVYSGAAALDVPVGRTLGGEVVYKHAALGMAPDGVQTDLEVTYGRTITDGITSNLHLVVQNDAGHRRGALEGGALARIRLQF